MTVGVVRPTRSADPRADPEPHGTPVPLTRIAPVGGWPGLDLPELWAYRGLLRFLVWREVRVRYAQTVLGAAWAVVQPLLTMAVFTIVFGRFARIPSDGRPYWIFALVALVPWSYLSTAVTSASGSLVTNTNLVTKVYFPRLVIPAAPVIAGLLDLAIALLLLLLAMVAFGMVPQPQAVVLVPLLVCLMMLTAMGVGSLFGALNIQYRDVKHVMPFVVQVWMFASPIAYPLSLVPDRYRLAYALNPMVGVVEGFRTALLGSGTLRPAELALSGASAVALFALGTLYFRHTERFFADVA
jgi:lipopolysaccharide transport system permease protein